MRRVRLALVLVGVGCALLVIPISSFGAAGRAQGSLSCSLAGSWSQSTPGIGSSTWDVKADGTATEDRLGMATGKATLSGSVLRITWETGSWEGVYEWKLKPNCESESGSVTFTAGPRAGQKRASKLTGYAAATKTKTEPPAPGKCRKLSSRRTGPECEYTVSYKFSLKTLFGAATGHGKLVGTSVNDLTSPDVASDAEENTIRVGDGRTTNIVLEVDKGLWGHNKGATPSLLLVARVHKSTMPRCKRGAIVKLGLVKGESASQSATPSGDRVYTFHSSDSDCRLARYLYPSEDAPAFPTGESSYHVVVTAGGQRFQSTWRVTVTKEGTISGTSGWTCCPGTRNDPLSGGAKEGNVGIVEIVRDCKGQGNAGACSQTYVASDINDGRITGAWTGTGGQGGFEMTCQVGACKRAVQMAAAVSKGYSASISIQIQVRTR
jgi:hypothetical protein